MTNTEAKDCRKIADNLMSAFAFDRTPQGAAYWLQVVNNLRALADDFEDRANIAAEVDTSRYEAEHGCKPRGLAHWGFNFDNDKVTWWVPENTFGAAKRKALNEAKRRGAKKVEVAP